MGGMASMDEGGKRKRETERSSVFWFPPRTIRMCLAMSTYVERYVMVCVRVYVCVCVSVSVWCGVYVCECVFLPPMLVDQVSTQ